MRAKSTVVFPEPGTARVSPTPFLWAAATDCSSVSIKIPPYHIFIVTYCKNRPKEESTDKKSEAMCFASLFCLAGFDYFLNSAAYFQVLPTTEKVVSTPSTLIFLAVTPAGIG